MKDSIYHGEDRGASGQIKKYTDYSIPVSTRRRFDVHTTSITLKRRRMDVKTTLCAYWDV